MNNQQTKKVDLPNAPIGEKLDCLTKVIIELRDMSRENLEKLGGESPVNAPDFPCGCGVHGKIDNITQYIRELLDIASSTSRTI